MHTASRFAIALSCVIAGARHRPQTDSIQIVVTNNMPHPMTMSYYADSGRRPLGDVDGGGERTLTLTGLSGDSVTVWATNEDPPHQLSRKFPAHTNVVQSWAF